MSTLVDVARYQRITGDTSTGADEVQEALLDAEQGVAEHLRRVTATGRAAIAYGSYTESLAVYGNGRVYPAATPIDTVQTPAGARVDGNAVDVGRSVGTWNLFGSDPAIQVTYTGGWQAAGVTDGPTAPLPVAIVRAICQIAWQATHPVQFPGVPASAGQVSVGDVTISARGSATLNSSVAIDPGTAASIAGYIRRDILPTPRRF